MGADRMAKEMHDKTTPYVMWKIEQVSTNIFYGDRLTKSHGKIHATRRMSTIVTKQK